MSTETTNKKIKIDNGTTFGRTYTDKAVDELLKNVGGVIELTGESGTIAFAQLVKIDDNPQNFVFKYNGKILSFTKNDSTTYQYCNNTTSSSDNNVGTVSTLLTITSSTGAYTITENVHNVVANAAHPANGGDLTNIQVGSKVYSIPSGGGGIPVVEGTLVAEESTESTKNYTIPEAQTSPFIFHSSDIGYFFVDVDTQSDLYASVSPTPEGQWNLIYGNDTSITVNLYTPVSLYRITINGSIPTDETSSVDVTFPLMERISGSMCLVSDIDVSMVFVRSERNIWGSFQTPITYCHDGKYRCWYMEPKEGTAIDDPTCTIKCKVLNLDGGGTNIPSLPADASTSTYVLKAVNGTIQWVKEA